MRLRSLAPPAARRRFLLLFTSCALGGCAMQAEPNDSSAAVGAATAPSDLQPAAGRAVLVVSRERDGFASSCAYRVSIDGRPLAELRPGGWVTAYPAAAHTSWPRRRSA